MRVRGRVTEKREPGVMEGSPPERVLPPQPPQFAAPVKVCPHCGAQAQTAASKCPNCGKGYKRRTALKVLAVLAGVGVLFVVGCVALIGGAANEVSKELDKEQKAHAITTDQFRSVTLGSTESEVISQLGKQPENRQEFQNEGFDEPQNSSCIYYNKEGGSFGDAFQFCFTEGKLDAKNAY